MMYIRCTLVTFVYGPPTLAIVGFTISRNQCVYHTRIEIVHFKECLVVESSHLRTDLNEDVY